MFGSGEVEKCSVVKFPKITKRELEDIEEGRIRPSVDLVYRMAILYRVEFVD